MSNQSKPDFLRSRECHQCHKWGFRLFRSLLHFERFKCEECVNRDLRHAAPRVGPASAPGHVRRALASVG